MIETDLDHCQVVQASLAGNKAVDQQVLTSLAVLNDRLELLKTMNPAFSTVCFSPGVEQLKTHSSLTSVG